MWQIMKISLLFLLTLSQNELVRSQDSAKVNIDVYYETLCPDSKRFINNQVSQIFDNPAFQSIANIVLIPFGKAIYNWSSDTNLWNYRCQHGPDECYGNMIHNCLIYYYPEFEQHFEFINCTMTNIRDNIITVSSECSTKYSIPFSQLTECANNSLGNQLLYASGRLTHSLFPSLTYVPWINSNKAHTSEIQNNAERYLVDFICQNYKGNVDTSSFCKTTPELPTTAAPTRQPPNNSGSGVILCIGNLALTISLSVLFFFGKF